MVRRGAAHRAQCITPCGLRPYVSFHQQKGPHPCFQDFMGLIGIVVGNTVAGDESYQIWAPFLNWCAAHFYGTKGGGLFGLLWWKLITFSRAWITYWFQSSKPITP